MKLNHNSITLTFNVSDKQLMNIAMMLMEKIREDREVKLAGKSSVQNATFSNSITEAEVEKYAESYVDGLLQELAEIRQNPS